MRNVPSESVNTVRPGTVVLIGLTNTCTPANGCPLSFTTEPLIAPVVSSSAFATAGVATGAAVCARTTAQQKSNSNTEKTGARIELLRSKIDGERHVQHHAIAKRDALFRRGVGRDVHHR